MIWQAAFGSTACAPTVKGFSDARIMRGSQCCALEVAAQIQIVRPGLRYRLEQADFLKLGEPLQDMFVGMAAQTGTDHGGGCPGADQLKHPPVFNRNVGTLVHGCLAAGVGASVDSLCWLHVYLHG